jgi:hypothetical protein
VRAGGAATYKFPTTSKEFLQANFEPAIFSALPFTWTVKGLLAGRQLTDQVTFLRTHGVLLDLIVQLHNECVARPVTSVPQVQARQLSQDSQAAPLTLYVLKGQALNRQLLQCM